MRIQVVHGNATSIHRQRIAPTPTARQLLHTLTDLRIPTGHWAFACIDGKRVSDVDISSLLAVPRCRYFRG